MIYNYYYCPSYSDDISGILKSAALETYEKELKKRESNLLERYYSVMY